MKKTTEEQLELLTNFVKKQQEEIAILKLKVKIPPPKEGDIFEDKVIVKVDIKFIGSATWDRLYSLRATYELTLIEKNTLKLSTIQWH